MQKLLNIRLVVIVALLATLLAAVVPASANGATATVNTYALNVRSGPSVSYARLGSVSQGTVLTLFARNYDATWVRVQAYTGLAGWVSVPYIYTTYPIGSLPVEGATGDATGTVAVYGLNVRTGPGASFARITAISRGTGFLLLARNYDATWVKIRLYDGREGWVNASYITTSYPLWNLPVEGGTPPPPPPNYRTHTVQPGENLFRISLRYGVSMYDIALANGITNLSLIYVGQVLVIP